MQIIDTKIADVKIIEPNVYGDDRGFFLETFSETRYQEQLGICESFVQDNHSRSQQHVLRGLHFQTENPQGKLVRTVTGEVFDVAVDIRPDSPTFKQWVGITLSESNKRQLWIPAGLAHGFVVLSKQADFEYKCTEYYDQWPVEYPILSDKDKQGKCLDDWIIEIRL
jgi:dTDP-4-dehydrorhamnose 3,5-epimerase